MRKTETVVTSGRRVRRSALESSERSVSARLLEGVNEVHLVGRVTTGPEERTLPSGARLVTFRVSVRRNVTAMTRGSGQPVDVVDCVAWSAQTRRVALKRSVGDVVDLRGCLRRRFFRTPSGSASRFELEVLELRTVEAAG